MKPASKGSSLLFPAFLSRALGYGDQFAAVTDGFIAIPLGGSALPAIPAGFEVRRYLDRYHLVLPAAEGPERAAVVERFFGWLAPNYEGAIDPERNRNNIQRLLALVELRGGPLTGKVVLDFGCGTGLAAPLVQRKGAQYVGCDSCPEMRAIASERGVDARNCGDLVAGREYDAIIASYVLHFRLDTKALEPAWAMLREGGIFVANFHKDSGLKQFLRFAGLKAAIIETKSGAPHGTYIMATKHRHGAP